MSYSYTFGYTCAGCGAWVANGMLHSCSGCYTPPAIPAPVPITIMPGVNEERVREIVREEIERAKSPEE